MAIFLFFTCVFFKGGFIFNAIFFKKICAELTSPANLPLFVYCFFSPKPPSTQLCILVVGPSSSAMWDTASAWLDEWCHIPAEAECVNFTTWPWGQLPAQFLKLHTALNSKHSPPLALTAQPPLLLSPIIKKGSQHHGFPWGPPLTHWHSKINEVWEFSPHPTSASVGMTLLHYFHCNSIALYLPWVVRLLY